MYTFDYFSALFDDSDTDKNYKLPTATAECSKKKYT